MKKILFLLILCIIKLNAYEYLVFENLNDNTNYRFYTDEKGRLALKQISKSGNVTYNYGAGYWFSATLSGIKHNSNHYMRNNDFMSLFKQNPLFLNDFYTQSLQPILNYFYNPNSFNGSNFIQYNDYELLYNSDGLAVESLVNGVYAGLYNMDEMQFSGNLYNENGDLVLVNGVETSFFQVLCDKLIGDLHLKMLDAENLIDKGWIFAVALTLAIFYFIARTLKRVLIGKNNKGVENES